MTGLTLSLSQLVQAVPDRYSHLWQRIEGCTPPDPTGRTTKKQYAARYEVGCHMLYSDFRFPPRYTLLSLQHCDAFSTRKEHHDQSTDTRSGGRPLDHSEKLCAHHHRLSAASSELDRLDGSSYIGREHRGHSPPGEGLCVAHRAFHRQRQDRQECADDPPTGGSA